MYAYNNLPFKGPVTCVAYHPFENVVAMCGLGGRTVSVVCFTDHKEPDVESIDTFSSPMSGSGTLVPAAASAGPQSPVKQAATRRKLLQKSMTVDSQSTIPDRYEESRVKGSSSGRLAAIGNKIKSKQSLSPSRDPREVSSVTGTGSSDAAGSRMKRAMKRLEIALMMKSLDRS